MDKYRVQIGRDTNSLSTLGRLTNSIICLLLFLSISFTQVESWAESPSYTQIETPRFTLYFSTKRLPTKDLQLNAKDLSSYSLDILNQTYDELTTIFNRNPRKRVVLRFLTPEQFTKQTGAPSWTSAMYFRNEISIPLNPEVNRSIEEIGRALKHEYTHAVIAEISKNSCPAWLDEGIAQLIEGSPNPLLGPALRNWIRKNPAMPLDWLQNGFTNLDSELVPAAYAQSLYATRKLVIEHGYRAINTYLAHLAQGVKPQKAFELAFHQSETRFEQQLTTSIRRWAKSAIKDP